MLRVEPYLDDYGITRVAHLTNLDRVGIPVHTAHKPAGKSLSNGSGKGVEQEASRIGAIMEAIEQTYWEDCEIPRIKASYQALKAGGIACVAPDQVPMNRANFWNERLTIEWTPLTDVVTGTEVLVPADLVGLPFTLTGSRIAVTHMCSSNGLASGNNVVEALLSGLTEVMERDALAIMVATTGEALPGNSLNLDQLREQHGDPFSRLLDKLTAAELGLSVHDRTGSGGLPTYKCLIWEAASGGAGTFGGYGSNLDPSIALVRALTEAVQARCLIIAGARDDQFRCGRDASQLWSRQSRQAPSLADLNPTQYDDLSTGSLRSDVELLVGILRDHGMPQVLLHRYTAPSDPVQVIRVVVPGLEGYMFSNYQRGPRAQAAVSQRLAVPA